MDEKLDLATNIELAKKSNEEYSPSYWFRKSDISRRRMTKGIWKGLKGNLWSKNKTNQDHERTKNQYYKGVLNCENIKTNSTFKEQVLIKTGVQKTTLEKKKSPTNIKIDKTNILPSIETKELKKINQKYHNDDDRTRSSKNNNNKATAILGNSVFKFRKNNQLKSSYSRVSSRSSYKTRNNLSISRQIQESKININGKDNNIINEPNKAKYDNSLEISEFINNIIENESQDKNEPLDDTDGLFKARDSRQNKDTQNTNAQKKIFHNFIGAKAKNIFENLNVTQRALAESLGNKNLREIVRAPNTVCKEQWLASLQDVQLVMSCLWDYCQCELMIAGCIVYFCKMDGKIVSLNSKNYIERAFVWINEQLADTNILSLKESENFRSITRTCALLIFRIYAHVYRHHIHHLETYNAVANLNSCFKHFLFLTDEFQLLNESDLMPLKNICKAYLNETISECNNILTDSTSNQGSSLSNLKILKSAFDNQINEENGDSKEITFEDSMIFHRNDEIRQDYDSTAKVLLSYLN